MSAGETITVAQVIGVAGILSLGVLMLYSKHTKGARKSTKQRHQEGQSRMARDKRGFIRKHLRSIIKKGKWVKGILWFLNYELFEKE